MEKIAKGAEEIRNKWSKFYDQMFNGEAPSAAQFQTVVAHDLIELSRMVRDLAKRGPSDGE